MSTVPVNPVTAFARVAGGDPDVEARACGLRPDAPAAGLLDQEEREHVRVDRERVARPGLSAADVRVAVIVKIPVFETVTACETRTPLVNVAVVPEPAESVPSTRCRPCSRRR